MSLPPSYNLLEQYVNPVYVETGIYRGDSIQLAIDAGFKHIIGIEYFEGNILFCKERFNYKNVREKVKKIKLEFIQGDSAACLVDVIKSIDQPITFFLDSHSQYLENEVESPTPFPLLDELLQIRFCRKRKNTIIIDDILHLTHPKITGWNYDKIESYLYSLNPHYNIKYIANPVKNNLLIATP